MNDIQLLDDELNRIKPVLKFLESYNLNNLPETENLCHPFLTEKINFRSIQHFNLK